MRFSHARVSCNESPKCAEPYLFDLPDVSLEVLSVEISISSSSRLPVASRSRRRILPSNCCNCFLSTLMDVMRLSRLSSSSGRSARTSSARSCSSRPYMDRMQHSHMVSATVVTGKRQ
jgi:hypothetical protein